MCHSPREIELCAFFLVTTGVSTRGTRAIACTRGGRAGETMGLQDRYGGGGLYESGGSGEEDEEDDGAAHYRARPMRLGTSGGWRRCPRTARAAVIARATRRALSDANALALGLAGSRAPSSGALAGAFGLVFLVGLLPGR